MPTNDQNGVTGSAPASTDASTSTPQDISDLGDILMEKTLDTTQSSDFVGVKPSDVDLLSTTASSPAPGSEAVLDSFGPIEDSQPTPITSPSTNDSLDLGDISLDDLTTPVVATPTPGAEEKKMDLNDIESISIPESTSIAINEEATTSPTTENSTEPLSVDLAPEAVAVEVPANITAFDTAPIIEQSQIDTTPTLEPVVENITSSDTPSVGDQAPVGESMPMIEAIPEAENLEPLVTPSETGTDLVVEQAPTEEVMNNTPEAVSTPQGNIDEKIAEVQATSDQIPGLDLDSLVSQSNVEDTTAPIPTIQVEPTPVVTVAPKSNKKQMGLLLTALGIIAVSGLAYFGYKTMYPVGIDGPTQTGNTDTTGMPMIITGDAFAETGNEIMSGNTDGSAVDSGTVATGSTATGSESGNSMQEPVITRESLVQSGNELASRVRKLLIKATIDKNGPARITAFGIQKDIEDFQQALEKTTDISTLGNVTGVMAGFSQRLDSLAQKLDGTSNQ